MAATIQSANAAIQEKGESQLQKRRTHFCLKHGLGCIANLTKTSVVRMLEALLLITGFALGFGIRAIISRRRRRNYLLWKAYR
jgi:hypothetical protein